MSLKTTGADMELKNEDGDTALDIAIEWDQEAVAHILTAGSCSPEEKYLLPLSSLELVNS